MLSTASRTSCSAIFHSRCGTLMAMVLTAFGVDRTDLIQISLLFGTLSNTVPPSPVFVSHSAFPDDSMFGKSEPE